MLPLLRAGRPRRRAPRSPSSGSTRTRRPEHAATLQTGPPGQRRRRAGRRADRRSSASSAAACSPGAATARTRSTSTIRRSSWPARRRDLTPASGAFVMDGGPSRRALTTAMLDLASRGADRVPRGAGLPRARTRRSASTIAPAGGDADDEARRARNARPPARAGRGGSRCSELDRARRRTTTATSSPTSCSSSARRSPTFDKALEDAGRRARLVPREAVEGARPLGDPRRHRRSSSASSRSSAASTCRAAGCSLIGGALVAGGDRRRSSCRAGCRR